MLSFLVYSCYIGNTVPSETFRCLLEDSITSGLCVTAVAAAVAGMCDGTACSALPVGRSGDQLKSTPRQVFMSSWRPAYQCGRGSSFASVVSCIFVGRKD